MSGILDVRDFGCQDRTVPPSGFRFSPCDNDDRFVQSMGEFSCASVLVICCWLASVICDEGTSEPYMARMLGVMEKCPSNDTNDFEGRKDARK
jgi:hypothetical protein